MVNAFQQRILFGEIQRRVGHSLGSFKAIEHIDRESINRYFLKQVARTFLGIFLPLSRAQSLYPGPDGQEDITFEILDPQECGAISRLGKGTFDCARSDESFAVCWPLKQSFERLTAINYLQIIIFGLGYA